MYMLPSDLKGSEMPYGTLRILTTSEQLELYQLVLEISKAWSRVFLQYYEKKNHSPRAATFMMFLSILENVMDKRDMVRIEKLE